jgi:hypothetical protein
MNAAPKEGVPCPLALLSQWCCPATDAVPRSHSRDNTAASMRLLGAMRSFRLPTRVQAFLSVFGRTTACRNAEHKSDRRHWSVRRNVKVFARLAFTVSGVTVIGKSGSACSAASALIVADHRLAG